MRYTLVVNDVQKAPFFVAAVTPALVQAVAREIAAAVSLGNPIVFTEIPYYSINEDPYPPTEKELTDLVLGYARQMVIPKMRSDGSRNIQSFCDGMIEKSCFVLVGINTDACVFETAVGLHERYPHALIVVVRDACYSTTNTHEPDRDPWAVYAQHPYIQLVDSHAGIAALLSATCCAAA